MMHEETRFCHEHGCPDHGRLDTEWLHVHPDHRHIELLVQTSQRYQEVKSGPDWMDVDYYGPGHFTTCVVECRYKYTHHLCQYHDIILIREGGLT